MPPLEEVSLQEETPAGATQNSEGMELPETRGRISSYLLACNKLAAGT